MERFIHKAGLTKNTAPRLLSDNGSCYISNEIKSFFKGLGIKPINGKPCQPQTQGKIERYHRSMKNVVKLENYYSPEELEYAMANFIDYYNNHRYNESLNNITPADVFFGRGEEILWERALIKRKTMKKKRTNYYQEKHMELTLV